MYSILYYVALGVHLQTYGCGQNLGTMFRKWSLILGCKILTDFKFRSPRVLCGQFGPWRQTFQRSWHSYQVGIWYILNEDFNISSYSSSRRNLKLPFLIVHKMFFPSETFVNFLAILIVNLFLSVSLSFSLSLWNSVYLDKKLSVISFSSSCWRPAYLV